MLEDERVGYGKLLANTGVHHVDVGLIHGHALLGQARGVVDGHGMKFGMCLPVLVENQQELLSAPECECRDETAPASSHNLMDETLHGGEKLNRESHLCNSESQ